jgi:hypothetical protein
MGGGTLRRCNRLGSGAIGPPVIVEVLAPDVGENTKDESAEDGMLDAAIVASRISGASPATGGVIGEGSGDALVPLLVTATLVRGRLRGRAPSSLTLLGRCPAEFERLDG